MSVEGVALCIIYRVVLDIYVGKIKDYSCTMFKQKKQNHGYFGRDESFFKVNIQICILGKKSPPNLFLFEAFRGQL